MAEVVISPRAKADMRQIADYIRLELRNPGAALGMVRRFQTSILSLKDFPAMGTPLPASGKQGTVYRYLVCGSYLIFYRTEAETVWVDRVLYGRRDYLALLFGSQLEDTE